MRVFYALSLPQLMENFCLSIIDSLKSKREFSDVRWSHPDLLHITLRFHANIDEAQLNQINTLLDEQLIHYKTISLSTRRLLLLPHKKPHLIAVAINLNEGLAGLVRLINEATLAAGIPLEKRPYLGHITLGRFNESTVHNQIILTDIKTIADTANHVVLYQSEPTDKGSVYTPLKHFELDSATNK